LFASGGVDNIARIWDTSWLLVTGTELRRRVCAEKLIGSEEFTPTERDDPIVGAFVSDDPVERNPCLQRGPLSLEYWMRVPRNLWRAVRTSTTVRSDRTGP
jgi:hypothetical protein